MKRASFTLFQPQRWMSLGLSTLMVLFVWCCLGINTASAQVEMPTDGTPVTVDFTADECEDGTIKIFTDDGGIDGNYDDSEARRDTITFCPSDEWHRLYIEFTKFDLEENDTLHVFDGDLAAVRDAPGPIGIGSGTGVGASQMNGGWVRSSCDPNVNPSGCLTFAFFTDGNNSKGFGWEANATCEDRTAELEIADIANPKISCADIMANGAQANVTIDAPTVELCGAAANSGQDEVLVTVTNQRGDTCFSQIMSANGAVPSITRPFGVGAYKVNYTLIADTHESKQQNRTFTVQGPSLICNDNIEVPFGSACAVQLTPDDILENSCPEIPGVLSYNITIVLGEGKDAVELTTEGGVYPTITVDDITDAGLTVCSGTATVTIERTLTPPAALPAGCHNGPQNASCTTTLSFNDQSTPFITIDSDIDSLVACVGDEAALGALILESATAIDNCDSDVELAVKSVVVRETDPCLASDGDENKTTAVITISATDDCGNEGTITRTLPIIRPNLYDHLVKVGDETRDCNDDNNASDVPGLEVGTYRGDVLTVTDTVPLSDQEYICGYRLSKRDVDIPGTDCGKKIYRYWSVIDWCDASTGPTVVDTSFIEFTDEEAPTFVGEESDQVIAPTDIPLGPFACTYDINDHTAPSANDNCGLDEVVLHRVFRIEDGENWPVDREDWATLDCDSFRLMYIARDQCHEQPLEDTTRQIVVIKDVTNPSAICTDELNVSIANDEGSRISVDDIDAGSYDACVELTREIRKISAQGDTSAWGQTIDIVCTDVHNETRVELRVTDKQGNENICWMYINAEDKIAPRCENLRDTTFVCNEIHTGEFGFDTDGDFVDIGDYEELYNTRFGNPFAPDNCYDNLACGPLTPSQSYRLTEANCGELVIERRFSVMDWSGKESNVGTQTITVTYDANWSLTLPGDVSQGCDDGEFPAAWTSAEIIGNGSCDLWALEVTEKTFDVPGDICMKVERTYELINWCVYEAGTDAVVLPREDDGGTQIVLSEGREDVGRFTYVQVLKLYANDAPSIVIHEVDTCLVGEGDLEPFGMADNTPGAAPFECDEERTFSASGTNCAERALTRDHYTWVFTPEGGTPERGNDSVFTRVVTPNTNYTVEFWVSDGCGNSSGDVKEYQFWDCKKPTPYVLHGLAIEMMQTGSIQLWANDLNQGSYDNCTVQNQLRYRLFEGDPADGPQNLTDILDLEENITFNCLTTGIRNVSFYVIDEKGNWDVVATYVSVQANNGICPGDGNPIENGRIAGKITSAQGDKVELVNVSVNGGDNTMATGASGEFQFDLALAGDYTITPEKNINPLNGVSTFDLVLISKHILGIQSFDSPYKYIAADVNKSGTITAFDMVQLRQLILNITSEFSNNSSWRFVDAKHEFTSENPAGEKFDEFMNINNLAGQMLDVDFIATKIGDVNGSATSNSLQSAESRTTNGTLNLNVTDRFVEAGQTVTVDFTTADIAATQGYQFTMNFAGLDLVELNEGVAKANNFNTTLAKRGLLTTSWNGEATDENLFSLTFTATTNGLLSELVSVSSEVTVAEAYNTAGELLDVELNFNSSNVSAAFELNQNTPNPFNGQTLIGFNLPQAGMATLKVMDVQGKVLTVIAQEGVKGYNQVTLNAKSLGATGVLYYQLESADNIATKKMIIID